MPGLSAERVVMLLLNRYEGSVAFDDPEETAILFNPGGKLPKGALFASLRENDGTQDNLSALDRPGLFRLDVAVDKPRFAALFGDLPEKPAKGEPIAGDWDFTRRDRLMPHPMLGAGAWVSVINPSLLTFEQCLPLLDAAYAKAKTNFARRMKREQ